MKIIQGSYLQGYIFSFFTLEERTKTHHIYLFLVQDLPDDPTGELDKVQKFVEENLDICKWVALSVVVLEVSNFLPIFCCMISLCFFHSDAEFHENLRTYQQM
jgi:hypothetical protein